MRSDVHLRDGVALLLLVLMMVLVSLPLKREKLRQPANNYYPGKVQTQK